MIIRSITIKTSGNSTKRLWRKKLPTNMTGQLLWLLIACIVASNVQSFAPSMGRFFRTQSQSLTMATDITMPALSSTMTEGKIVAWSKKIGDKVTAGDVLLIVESDKADMDVEAYEDGYLAAIYTPEGGSAAVGATVAVLVDAVSEIGSVGSAPSTPAAAPADAAVPVPVPIATTSEVSTLSSDKFEQVTMPALSSTMTEGKVVSWSKKIGDKISSGDMVLIVESDKADMDVESYEEGFLAAILVGEGESAPVGSPVGLMAKTVGDIPSVQAYANALKKGGTPQPHVIAAPLVAAPVAVAAVAAATIAAPASSSFTPAAGTINASPQARKLALENNLDLSKIKGTGNFGRVMPDDVLFAAGKKVAVVTPVAAPVVAVPVAAAVVVAKAKAVESAPIIMEGVVAMDGMQKAVAKNMEKTMSTPIFRVSR
jgi:pyruvate dehydrogenase E2 component (dihydrolipoamide acetyltransferase)